MSDFEFDDEVLLAERRICVAQCVTSCRAADCWIELPANSFGATTVAEHRLEERAIKRAAREAA